MIRLKFYRWIRVKLGARSFVLTKDGQENTYILLNGGWDRIAQTLIRDGYVEEWSNNA